jgi:hypothetical protein
MQQGYIPDNPQPYQTPSGHQGQSKPAQPPVGQWSPPHQGWQPPPQQPQQGYQQPYQPQLIKPAMATPRVKRSLLLLISAVLGLVFFFVLVGGTFSRTDEMLSQAATTAEEVGVQLGTMIGAALLIPQMIATGIAVILNGVGWGIRSRGFALTGAIVYCVAAVLMIINAPFLLPSIVLSFVGYAKMRKEKT